jgi:hypothetical protein
VEEVRLFVWRFVRNSSAAVHDLTHITVAFKTRKIIENTHGPVHDFRVLSFFRTFGADKKAEVSRYQQSLMI